MKKKHKIAYLRVDVVWTDFSKQLHFASYVDYEDWRGMRQEEKLVMVHGKLRDLAEMVVGELDKPGSWIETLA